MKRKLFIYTVASIALFGLWGFTRMEDYSSKGVPLYITGITTFDNQLVMTQKGTQEVVLYSSDGTKKLKSWKTNETPTGVVAGKDLLYVTTSKIDGGIEIINPKHTNTKAKFIATGRGACSPLLHPNGQYLYVCNQFATTVSEIDLKRQIVSRTVRVLREPKSAAVSIDGKYLFVSNFLPTGRADRDNVAASVSVIDLETFTRVKDIQLESGSNAVRSTTLSPDGQYLFVTHNLGRFQIPTSQLQQGWMNTSAISIINTTTLTYGGAILLDEPDRGAAGIWGVECTPEHLVITHSGTHEISLINYLDFINRYEACADKSSLSYDLRFLTGFRQRIPIQGNGPRNFIIYDNKAVIPSYFSDTLNFIPLTSPEEKTAIAMTVNRQESAADRGERYFNDASFCFQNWQSCNGCHPGEGRTDGLNWDLLNDGVGNPKNCKSLLFSHETAPNMISGIRPSAEVAVRAGFKYIQFCEVEEEIASCVDEYLKQLLPVPSPYLVNGELSEKAVRGKAVFEKYSCDFCHKGAYYTDKRLHVIGDDVEFEKGWDTPTLREVWRTSPYLFDGRAATMEEVFTIHQHGLKDKEISKKEIEELVEFVNSL